MATTGAYATVTDKYRLGPLSMVLWVLSAFIFVDHTLGWAAEGGEYLEVGLDPFLLSIAMLIPIFGVWEAYILTDKIKSRASCERAEPSAEAL